VDAPNSSYNLIITGVGGQGNVLSSQLIGQAFVRKGYFVTIGETYGASQRGGSVMSHIRVSSRKQLSPLIPKGKADIVIALEPVEALRVITHYGNPETVAIVNPRPVYPVDVSSGDEKYPAMEEIQKALTHLCRKVYYIPATEKALAMGSAILGNMIMIGALLAAKLLPLQEEDFCRILAETFRENRLTINLQALAEGQKSIQGG
jgi:indolepyruvate ferredoxin oxidoreductase beta subunit